jgi:hypothetical protein
MRTATLKEAAGNAVELFSTVSGALVITTPKRPLCQTFECEKALLKGRLGGSIGAFNHPHPVGFIQSFFNNNWRSLLSMANLVPARTYPSPPFLPLNHKQQENRKSIPSELVL